MAKVSICIPCYNNALEVERLLQSIYEQDYTDFEVNISDDSTDNETQILVKRYTSEKDIKLNYVHNIKPLGHIYNWNTALNMATGEYIKIMFSDDWFTDKKSLGEFVKMLDDKPNALIGFCGSRQVMLDKDSTEVKHITKEHIKESYDRFASDEFIKRLDKDYRNLFLGNEIGAPSAVIYRRGNKLALFDEKSNWASDMFLYFELLCDNGVFAYTKLPLVSIGVHENQYTESFSERDIRIYNDYRYMFTKYNLKESQACREFFTEKFIIKYKQGFKEVKALGIERSVYYKKWFAEQKETLKCFIKARMKNRGNK